MTGPVESIGSKFGCLGYTGIREVKSCDTLQLGPQPLVRSKLPHFPAYDLRKVFLQEAKIPVYYALKCSTVTTDMVLVNLLRLPGFIEFYFST